MKIMKSPYKSIRMTISISLHAYSADSARKFKVLVKNLKQIIEVYQLYVEVKMLTCASYFFPIFNVFIV